MLRKLSRMESNKEIRRVLNRHMVDLAYCQYSCYGTDIKLTGWLCKADGTDFTAPQIESMISEFCRRLPGYMICGDFENWNFNSEHITYIGENKLSTTKEELESVEDEDDLYEKDLGDSGAN